MMYGTNQHEGSPDEVMNMENDQNNDRTTQNQYRTIARYIYIYIYTKIS